MFFPRLSATDVFFADYNNDKCHVIFTDHAGDEYNMRYTSCERPTWSPMAVAGEAMVVVGLARGWKGPAGAEFDVPRCTIIVTAVFFEF